MGALLCGRRPPSEPPAPVAKTQNVATELPPLSAPRRDAIVCGATTVARVTRVIDGDTIEVVTRFSDAEPWAAYSVRMQGIDAPELRVDAQHLAAVHVKCILTDVLPPGTIVRVACAKVEKFGRVLATVFLATPSPAAPNRHVNVNEWLLRNKLVAPVLQRGGKRQPWTQDALDAILATRKCVEAGCTLCPPNVWTPSAQFWRTDPACTAGAGARAGNGPTVHVPSVTHGDDTTCSSP